MTWAEGSQSSGLRVLRLWHEGKSDGERVEHFVQKLGMKVQRLW